MKFTAIFLTGAALAQHALVFPEYGPPIPINNAPGECISLNRPVESHAFTKPDIKLKFYTGHNCDGKQVPESTPENFNPNGPFYTVNSVKAVYIHELTNEEASYYIYWPRP
jgi:hypothetical protein